MMLIQIFRREQAGGCKATDNPDDAQHGTINDSKASTTAAPAANHARQMKVADPIEILDC